MWRLIKLLVIPVPLAAAFFLFTEHQKHVARQQALGGAELSMFEFAKGQYASMVNASAQAALKPLDVQMVMPAAPQGWTRETFATEHGAKITRAAFDPSAPVTTTDAALQTDFLSAAGQHHNMAAMSYINGNKVFALRMRPLPNSEETDLAAAESDGLSNPVVTKLGEVPMHLLPQMSHDLTTGDDSFVAYQRFHAEIDGRLDILVFGNGSLDDLRAILAGIDPELLMDFAANAHESPPTAPNGSDQGGDATVVLAADVSGDAVSQAQTTSWVSTLREIALGSNNGGGGKRVVLTCSQSASGFKRCAK